MTKPLSPDDLMTALWAVHHNGSTLRAILTTIKEAGWKIVPMEATAEMVGDVEDHVVGCCNLSKRDATEIWQAMQSAAPQIEGE